MKKQKVNVENVEVTTTNNELKRFSTLQEIVDDTTINEKIKVELVNIVNKKVNSILKKEKRIEYLYKKREYDKITKLINDLEKFKLDIPKDLTDKQVQTFNEVNELKKYFDGKKEKEG